jgi:hypothetical protein
MKCCMQIDETLSRIIHKLFLIGQKSYKYEDGEKFKDIVIKFEEDWFCRST